MQKEYVVILFYKFVDIANPQAVADAQKAKCAELGLLGRMLLAEEGVNATFEGTREAVDAYKAWMKQDPLFGDILIKESAGTGQAFRKLSIRVRKEIVTLGAGRFDVAKETATELPSAELEKWYENNEDFVVLDLRNDYEIVSGQFDRTIDPGLANVRDLPQKISDMGDLKNKKVVTVCTGGIRCEKAAIYMAEAGVERVFQLEGGILKYFEQTGGTGFEGNCFVFDERETLDPRLHPHAL